MRRCLILLLFLMASLIVADPQQTAQQADAAYLAGDYATAIDLYESLVSEGFTNADIYHNLASAYFESDDLGRALLNFQRAQRFAPRDFDINKGIALARALRVDVLGDETALIDNIAGVTSGLLTTTELSILTFLLWVGWFSLLMAWIFRRDRFRLWLIGLGIVVIVMLTLLLGRLYAEQNRPAAVVTAFTAQAMSGPGEEYVSLYLLYSGAEARILEIQGEWTRFILPDGRQGWMRLEALEKV